MKMKVPGFKFQVSKNLQASCEMNKCGSCAFADDARSSHLEFEPWSFSGTWDLEFETSQTA
jgi:hypothetical protein